MTQPARTTNSQRKGQGMPEYLAMGAVLIILCILFVAYMFQSDNTPQLDTETPVEVVQPQDAG